jgi:hypothetical protein
VIVGGRVLAEGTVDEVGSSLEQRFIELSGGISDAEGLEWLHTFSDRGSTSSSAPCAQVDARPCAPWSAAR